MPYRLPPTAYRLAAVAAVVVLVLAAIALPQVLNAYWTTNLILAYLGERPVPNQYVGVGLVAAGLVLLGLA